MKAFSAALQPADPCASVRLATTLNALPKRLAKIHLRLAEEKSALVKFNRWEPKSSGRSTFLGFHFYWGRSRRNSNHWRMRRRTNKKKFRAGLAKFKDWVKKSRNTPLREPIPTLRRKLQGHWNYYGVIGNSKRTGSFAHFARRLVFKWLNRRSQRKSYTWAKLLRHWQCGWQIPRISWLVREALAQAGIKKTKTFKRPRTAGAWDLANWSLRQDLSTWTKRGPGRDIKPGDIIGYRFSHCGLAVTKPDINGHFLAIEGNTDGKGSREGGAVLRKRRHTSRVRFRIRFRI